MDEIETLRKLLPELSQRLITMMVNDALPMFQATSLTMEDAVPSVSAQFAIPGFEREVKITLSVGYAGDEDDDDDGIVEEDED